MIQIDVHKPIDKDIYFCSGEENYIFSLDGLRSIVENPENKDDKDIKLNIHSDGGSVSEGLAIYDYLRMSGKNIYCNIDGDCHSMALVLLLSAPKENRTANPNCSALIHEVRLGCYGEVTEKEAERIAGELKQWKEKILEIYAQRTGTDKEELRSLMCEEKVRDAEFLLQYGFISEINSYTTNLNTRKPQNGKFTETENINNTKENANFNLNKTLTEMKQLLKKATDYLINRVATAKAMNFVFKDVNDEELFTTESETDELLIGMQAKPDGIFTLVNDTAEYPAKTVVTVKDGVIIDILPYEPEGQEAENRNSSKKVRNQDQTEQTEETTKEDKEKIEALEKENKELSERLNDLEQKLTALMETLKEKDGEIAKAKNLVSGFVVEQRKTLQRLPQQEEMSLKEKIYQNRKQIKEYKQNKNK